MPTRVVVLAAPLHSEAWRALLDGQPEILVAGLAGEASEIPALLSPSQPGAVLVDLPLSPPSGAPPWPPISLQWGYWPK